MKARGQLAGRFVAAWVAISFLASLTVCCDLFAAETNSKKVVKTVAVDFHLKGHHHDLSAHFHKVNPTKDRKDDCVSANLPDLADSQYVVSNWPTQAKIVLAQKTAILPGTRALPPVGSQMGPDPPPPTSPRYLLFHRLLIAHLFV